MDFFAFQLERLKDNINKLVSLSRVEEGGSSMGVHSFNVQDPEKIFKSRMSQEAKSTQSQEYKTDSPKRKA